MAIITSEVQTIVSSSLVAPLCNIASKHTGATLSSFPWFAEANSAKEGKVKPYIFPASLPDLEVADVAKTFADLARARELMIMCGTSSDTDEVADAGCLKAVLSYGIKRKEFNHAAGKSEFDIKGIVGLKVHTSSLILAMNDLTATINQCDAKRVRAVMAAERQHIVETFGKANAKIMTKASTLSAAAAEVAEQISFDAAWTPARDGDVALRVVNSKGTQQLRGLWPDVVNTNAAIVDFRTELTAPVHASVLTWVDIDKAADYESYETTYQYTCNKLFEVTVYRALFRPKNESESRKQLVQKALDTAEQLKGALPPTLDLHVKASMAA